MRTDEAPVTMIDPIWCAIPVLLAIWWVIQWAI